ARRQFVIDTQIQSLSDDLRLREFDERSVNMKALPSFHPGLRGQSCHSLVRLNVLGSAIGITAEVDSINSDEQIVRTQYLGPSEPEGQENSISRRHICDRDSLSHLLVSPSFRDGNVVSQC